MRNNLVVSQSGETTGCFAKLCETTYQLAKQLSCFAIWRNNCRPACLLQFNGHFPTDALSLAMEIQSCLASVCPSDVWPTCVFPDLPVWRRQYALAGIGRSFMVSSYCTVHAATEQPSATPYKPNIDNISTMVSLYDCCKLS